MKKRIDKIPFARYQGLDAFKRQLLLVWNTDHFSDESQAAHALGRRQKEAAVLWLYMPGLFFIISALSLILGGFFTSGVLRQFFCFGAAGGVLATFRWTFYSAYLDTCTNLARAAFELRVGIGQTVPNPAAELTEQQIATLELPLPPVELTITQKTAVPMSDSLEERTYYGEELKILFSQPNNHSPKGRIPTFLLDQRIRHECRRPSVYDRSASNMKFSVRVINCKSKNIIDKYPIYRSKDVLSPKTRAFRTTHIKYLRDLEQHYEALGEKFLADKSREFLTAIQSTPLPKKMRKTQKINTSPK